jgi:hypothetical protein
MAASLHQLVGIIESAIGGERDIAPGGEHDLYLDASFHRPLQCLLELGTQSEVGTDELDAVLGIVDGILIEVADGKNIWTTTLTLTNGYRAEGSTSDTDEKFPIYPGFKADDNTAYEPGFVVEDQYDRTPPEVGDGDLVDDSGNAADFASSGKSEEGKLPATPTTTSLQVRIKE